VLARAQSYAISALTTVSYSSSCGHPCNLSMEALFMKSSARWFGRTVAILAVHMSEQLMFGIGELAPLKRPVAAYYTWFKQADYGTVALVTVVATLINLLIFGILTGGLWREISIGIFGVISVSEVHHLMETAQAGCTPGTIKAIPYVAVGVVMLRALFT